MTFAGLLKKIRPYAKYVHPLTVEQYLNTCDAQRRSRYARAAEKLGGKFPKPTQFVKLEPACPQEKVPVCRIITDPGPQYNLTIGMYIKPLERAVCDTFERYCGYPVIMKGYNSVEQGAIFKDSWDYFVDPIALGGDASRFDTHTGKHIMQLEHSFYKMFLPGHKNIFKILAKALSREVVGVANDAIIKYMLKCRASGDHNTGLGNSVITCCMVLLWSQMKDVEARLHDNGDDWTIIMERPNVAKFLDGASEYFMSLGYDMKIEPPVDVLERVDFCQTSPVFNGKEYVMARHPDRCRGKDLTTHKVRNNKEYRRWCAAVAECGLATCSGMPIMQSFYAHFHRSALGSKPGNYYYNEYGRKALSRGLKYKYSYPTDEARYSYYLAFDITPDAQKLIENQYDGSKEVYFEQKLYTKENVESSETLCVPEFGL